MILHRLAAGESPITSFFGLLAMVLVMSVLMALILTRAKQGIQISGGN